MRKATYTIFVLTTLFLAAAVNASVGRSGAVGMTLVSDSDSVQIAAQPDVVNPASIVDEVVWVVGDEPILKSDIEVTRLQGNEDGAWGDEADCRIPEQIAVQKLFVHQAEIDSIEVTEAEVTQGVEQRINYWIQMVGSREKLEEMRRMSVTQMRQEMRDEYRTMMLVQKMQEKLVEDVKVSPAEVRNYFKDVPQDSLPLIPTMVEVQIITQAPKIEVEEVNRVKDELRSYSDRVTNGETSFATLARLYSEDPGSARQGGELGYMGRGMLDPAFATVAFNLTDPKKVSKIVESEFGYHIIQLIDRRGDKINCRHILMKPKVSSESIEAGKLRLDSIANDMREGKFTFEAAATLLSDDKDTRSNNGLMVNATEGSRTSRFRMDDLPVEVAQKVEGMQVGEISNAFQMTNSKGKPVCAVVKLKSRTDAHRATIMGDFQAMQDIVLAKRREKIIHDWVVKKIKEIYVRMNPRYTGCDFEYEGWIK